MSRSELMQMAVSSLSTAVAMAACAGAAQATPAVILEPAATLPAGVVTLGQVCIVRDATVAEEQRLRALPVARLNPNEPVRIVNRLEIERVVARLLGHEASSLKWAGSNAVSLRIKRSAPGPVAIARRESVMLSSDVGPVRVEQPAMALANGRVGDVIGVRLPNGAIVRGQVRGPGHAAL